MIEVHVRFFAGQRDIVGQSGLRLYVEADTTVGGLWERLVMEYPRLQGYTGRMLCAVNQEYSDQATVLHAGDEVAYIPPVSGGTADAPALFAITDHPLVPEPLVRLVQTPGDGAIVTFAGVARNNFEGRATAFLTYEAYPEMAVPILKQIAEEAQARYVIGQAAIHHRVGQLEIGETAVLVVVAAPHRQAAFEAAAYMMDRIKQIAPIWKREHWAEGGSDWRDS